MAAKRLTPRQRLKALLKKPVSGLLDNLSVENVQRRVDEISSEEPEPTIGEFIKRIEESNRFTPLTALAGDALRSEDFLAKPYEDAIRAAFDAFQLDRKNPYNWRLLIGLLAYSHYGDPRRVGRERFWTGERYCQLLEDVDRLKSQNHRLSNTGACGLLKTKNQFKPRYEKQSKVRLQHALNEARDSRFNGALAQLVYKDGMAKIAERKRLGLEFSREEESKLIVELEQHYSEAIARQWRERAPKK